MITEDQFSACAKLLQVEVEAIKAVGSIEGSGHGFLLSGKPIILFEPHIFWKQLKIKNIDPEKFAKDRKYSDILYPIWGLKPYGPTSAQHERLERACTIDREGALSSASWGMFQIMGYNWKLCGAKNLQEFINHMYANDYEHLIAFSQYIKAEHLDDELRHHDWAGFARSYNGALYYKNNYDKKLELAYYTFCKHAA